MSDEYAGQSGRCPACGQTIRVPPSDATPGGRTAADCPQFPAQGDPAGRGLAGESGYVREGVVLWFLLGCVLVFALSNFGLMPLASAVRPNDPAAALVFVCFGAIGAQGGLHAVWCVLAPVGFIKRFAAGAVAGLVLFGAWAVGFAASEGLPLGEYDWQIVVTGLLCFPLIAIAIQLPLWLARVLRGWRVVHLADPLRHSSAATFGIRDVLVATGVVALALSAAKLAVPDSVSSEEEFLLPLAVGASAAAGISLLTTLPVVVATLRTGRPWIPLAAALILNVTTVFGAIAIIGAILRNPAPPQVYSFMAGGFYVCLAGVLLVIRGLGYRLSSGPQRLEDCR